LVAFHEPPCTCGDHGRDDEDEEYWLPPPSSHREAQMNDEQRTAFMAVNAGTPGVPFALEQESNHDHSSNVSSV